MTTPSFGTVPLFDPANGPSAGGAFSLLEAARESEVVDVAGWQVHVTAGDAQVVVSGGHDDNYEEAARASLLNAQRGLDLMSLRGGNNLVIKGFDHDHLVWWPRPTGLVIRAVSLAPVNIDVPPVTVTVRNSAGNVVRSPSTSPVAWHESFRYFRLSQTTDDLFDAYRNAYLALESVLSSIAPQERNAAGKVIEGEGAWFKRALAEADKIVPLASLLGPGIADPVEHAFNDFYVDMRSAMSHAKSGRRVLLPQDEAERTAVTGSLGRLVELYLKLAESQFGARRPGGGLFNVAFRGMFGPSLDRMSAYVTDDESPFDPSSPPALDEEAMRKLSPGAPAESPRPFVVTRLWTAEVADLSELPFIRGILAFHDRAATMNAVLDARLVLGSAQSLEVMLGVRGSNTRRPRTRYSF